MEALGILGWVVALVVALNGIFTRKAYLRRLRSKDGCIDILRLELNRVAEMGRKRGEEIERLNAELGRLRPARNKQGIFIVKDGKTNGSA